MVCDSFVLQYHANSDNDIVSFVVATCSNLLCKFSEPYHLWVQMTFNTTLNKLKQYIFSGTGYWQWSLFTVSKLGN